MRTGVIGCGSIGRRHIGNLLALGEPDILMHDANWETQWRAGIDPCIRGYASLDDLYSLGQPDCILICTPPDSHLALAEEAVDHHVKGVFIEKPLALSLGEWQKLACVRWLGKPIDRAAVTMVACNMRFAAGPLAIKAWLDEGAIGEVLSARFYCGYHLPSVRPDYATSYAATTGAILDIASHEVDMATWMLGPATFKGVVVRSAASIGLPDTDGLAELLLDHEGGAVSSVGVSWLTPGYLRYILVNGTKGRALWSWQGDDLSDAVLYGEHGCIIVAQQVVSPVDDMYRAELAAFLEAVREGKPSPNPISAATMTLNLLLEAKTWAAR